MQININVNVLTEVETIASNSIVSSSFNDYYLLKDLKQQTRTVPCRPNNLALNFNKIN